MKVVVTGSEGQLGYDVMRSLLRHDHQALGLTRELLDITEEEKTLNTLRELAPDAVIHCAAYTAVDDAEEDEKRCHEVNALGTKHVAMACKELDIPMIYISTDYVFDGSGEKPFEVNDIRNPQNVYGKTKAEGEAFVENLLDKYFIVRISWVFGIHGKNFVKTMLQVGKTRKVLQVVNDQVGSPTYTKDVAEFLMSLLDSRVYGIYHATNEGYCSWYEFAKTIFELSDMKDIKVEPVPSSAYKTKAKRPLNSRLSKENLQRSGLSKLPTWENALERFLSEISDHNK
ncbi:dTDP-4-dehydrorhamnose reductase [Proteiniclasticum sp. C24MP]|uniref:dTDP-4-dehydrorhamnose reductase n=1 Tax=Proteiniclasticum sp. C24MP TaxID=3374101 RepID=UPI0037550DE8